MNKLIAGVVAVLVAGFAFAADREQMNIGKLYLDGVEVTASAAELNIMDGVTATAAEINQAADLSARVTSVTVTNGKTITLSATTPVVVLTGSGQANGGSNVVSIATPYPVYQRFTFIVSPSSTNTVHFADSTSVLALGALTILDATDTLEIFTTATNAASKVGGSDN